MKALDWDDVRHFEALARNLNLAKAALELGTSQVTVMRRAKALELALGATLFLRRRDGHRLTPAGANFLEATQEAASAIRDGANRVAASDQKSVGRVRITTTEWAANWILLPALLDFRAANPDISLEIDASHTAMRLNEDGETLALRFRRPDEGAFRIRKLGSVTFGLYKKSDDGSGSVPEPMAGADRYIGWTPSFEDIGVARWLRARFPGVRPGLALTTLEGQLKAARAGLGSAALPDFIAGADPSLARIGDGDIPFSLEAWLVVPAQIAKTVRVRKVGQFIEAAFRAAVVR